MCSDDGSDVLLKFICNSLMRIVKGVVNQVLIEEEQSAVNTQLLLGVNLECL